MSWPMKSTTPKPLRWVCDSCGHNIKDHATIYNYTDLTNLAVHCDDCGGLCNCELIGRSAQRTVLAKLAASTWHGDLWRGLGS